MACNLNCVAFWVFLVMCSEFSQVMAETTHFTNSPNKLLSSKNFTTYKVEVPGASPITIIEANTPLHHSYYPQSSDEQYPQYSIHKQSAENANYDKSSQSMTITDPNSNSAAAHEDENEESVTNQSPEHGSIKTVYSPELLKKFLQDYADKVKHADEFAQDKLNELNKSASQNAEEIVAEDDDNNRRHSMELDDGGSIQRKNYQV